MASNALSPERMTASERLDEVAQLLVAGMRRARRRAAARKRILPDRRGNPLANPAPIRPYGDRDNPQGGTRP